MLRGLGVRENLAMWVGDMLQLLAAQPAFGLTSAAMLPAIVQLLRMHAPAGTDARAIAYASSFHSIGMGLAPSCAGLFGPVLWLRRAGNYG
jgi:hypothetical protein